MRRKNTLVRRPRTSAAHHCAAWLTAGSGPDGGYLAPGLLAQPPEQTAPAES